MTSRIVRGFHRIGAVLAIPPLLVGIWIACSETWMQWSSRDALAGAKDIPLFADLLPAPHIADFTAAWLLLGLAIALYVVARAIGWVLNGFMSPSRSGASRMITGRNQEAPGCTAASSVQGERK